MEKEFFKVVQFKCPYQGGSFMERELCSSSPMSLSGQVFGRCIIGFPWKKSLGVLVGSR